MSEETRAVMNLRYIGIGLIWIAVAATIIGVAAFTGNMATITTVSTTGLSLALLATLIISEAK